MNYRLAGSMLPQSFTPMKTRILIAILASALFAYGGDNAPVVVPVQSGGTATTSKFGDGYITRGSMTVAPASSPAAGNAIILPARK